MVLLSKALEDFRPKTAKLTITPATVLTLTTATVWQKIIGFSAFALDGFTFADNKITFTATDRKVLVNGETSLKVNKSCIIQYAFYINGVAGQSTTHTFTASSKIESFGVTGIADTLSTSDYIEIWAVSDTIATELTIAELDVSFWSALI